MWFNRELVANWMSKQADFEWIYPEAGVVSFPRIKKHVKAKPEKLHTIMQSGRSRLP
jgi:hypothetical protein